MDSSVTACLLHEQGHELIGVRFALWSDPLAPAMAQLLPGKCCNAQTSSRTAAVAAMLAIPLHVMNLEEVFKREVVDPFLDAYRQGLTPNPCIGCNRNVKFRELLRLADEWGCDKVATGHYARTQDISSEDCVAHTHLLEAFDAKKDQSYFLHGLSQKQLRRILFPLGELPKTEVFALAKKFNIPIDENYRESQDVCFFPERDPKPFLARHISDALIPGSIVKQNGSVIGRHTGLPYYTIGQRRGLGIGGLRIPLEVIGKRMETNELLVDDRNSHSVTRVAVRDISWTVNPPEENEPMRCECRTRSLSAKHSGVFTFVGTEGIFQFDTPLPLQTPGQSLVLYQGKQVLGGGVLEDGDFNQ